MAQIPQYKIVYTESAIQDIEEKADYIAAQFHDPDLAEEWYFRLKFEIQKQLTTFWLLISEVLQTLHYRLLPILPVTASTC